ncbi:MAG: transposase [Clostridiales bacterium]|jgi:transposase|nr:transposase [Clostridiales bacterium]
MQGDFRIYRPSSSNKAFYLPPYSPNLNLIERFWKYSKSEMLNSAHADTFAEFKLRNGIFLYADGKSNRNKVNSLISEKFQLFDEVESLTVINGSLRGQLVYYGKYVAVFYIPA